MHVNYILSILNTNYQIIVGFSNPKSRISIHVIYIRTKFGFDVVLCRAEDYNYKYRRDLKLRDIL